MVVSVIDMIQYKYILSGHMYLKDQSMFILYIQYMCMYSGMFCFFVCVLADRVQYRCDEQVFSPEELAIHCPGGAVRVEP